MLPDSGENVGDIQRGGIYLDAEEFGQAELKVDRNAKGETCSVLDMRSDLRGLHAGHELDRTSGCETLTIETNVAVVSGIGLFATCEAPFDSEFRESE